MQFVYYAPEVDFVRRMPKTLGTNNLFCYDVIRLSWCCSSRPFSSFYLIREVEKRDCPLDLERGYIAKELRIDWHNIDLIGVPPSRHLIRANAGVLA